jgi:hypothetical protein
MGERRRQRTSRLPLGIDVVLTPIHHPLHVTAPMATLDILSRGRVEAGIGCTGYPRMPESASPAACLQPAGRTARRPVRGWGGVRWPPQPGGCLPNGTVAQ